MNSLKPLIIIFTTAFLSFSGGFSLYHLPAKFQQITATTSTSSQVPGARYQQPVTMSLLPFEAAKERSAQLALEVGEEFNLELVIDARGEVINGADAIISFDPEILQVIEVEPQKGSTSDKSVFTFPRKKIEKGKIYLTMIKKAPDEIPTNQLTLATLTFKGQKNGSTSLILEHFPGKTYGSTIIRAKESKNILDEVSGLTVTIQ